MEQVAAPKYDWRTLEIFDEDGSQIKNPRTLKGIAKAQELIADWKKRMEQVYPATNENGEYYLYDDNGRGVTNQTTLRALAEGWEMIKAWRKKMEIFESESENEAD